MLTPNDEVLSPTGYSTHLVKEKRATFSKAVPRCPQPSSAMKQLDSDRFSLYKQYLLRYKALPSKRTVNLKMQAGTVAVATTKRQPRWH